MTEHIDGRTFPKLPFVYPEKLKEMAPLPWTVEERGLFGAEILASEREDVPGRLVVMRGPPELCYFVAQIVNTVVRA
jgi:hypothetical protein